jgi:hypothetical protein
MRRATAGVGIPDDEVDADLIAKGPEFGRLAMRLYYALATIKAPDGSLMPLPLGPFRYTLARATADADESSDMYSNPSVGSLVLIFDPEEPNALEEWTRRTKEAREEARQWQQ